VVTNAWWSGSPSAGAAAGSTRLRNVVITPPSPEVVYVPTYDPVAVYAPAIDGAPIPRPPVEPRIWSSEEVTWNVDTPSIADGPFVVMTTGDLPMTLGLLGDLPEGITFVDNGDGTADSVTIED